MRQFFDSSTPVLTPADLVRTFTGKKDEELGLPGRAVIVVNDSDIHFLRKSVSATLVEAWTPLRRIYRVKGRETLFARCWFGGPNIASLVEELSAFGVREFCLWGYLGGISGNLSVGDLVIARAALREEGVSHHYLEDDEDIIRSDWACEWSSNAACKEFSAGTVWSCDALYRETREKLAECRKSGVLGVEMEVASLYAVCRAKGLRAAAFLAVSDLFREDGTWIPGFFTPEFSKGARRLGSFLAEQAIV